ncbi:MAG: type II secretion system protein [Oscillospiraceae bacterium]
MKKTVKGFTLMELIVVMAIFGVIMAATAQLIPPVSKKLQLAENVENGNAIVSNISSYIKGQISPAEFMTVYNEVPYAGGESIDMGVVDGWVYDYVEKHYAGIVKGNTSADSPQFADGTIHVMFIENELNGRIRTVDYDNVVFGSGAPPFASGGTSVAPSVFNVPSVSTGNAPELAVNRAYYEDYDIAIRFGNFDTVDDFDAALTTPETFGSLAVSVNSQNTVFTIKATRHQTASEIARGATPLSFLEHSAMSLVNIYNKSSGKYMKDCYYIPHLVADRDAEGNPVLDATGAPVMVNGFVDLATHADNYDNSVNLYDGGSSNGYCIIYSYSSEINTRP